MSAPNSGSQAMGPAAGTARGWSRGRWLTLIALVCGAQVGFIFWLGARHEPAPRQAAKGANLRLAPTNSSELLTWMDPTLFALPHRHGFSGPGWLMAPRQEFQQFAWSEPPRWLELEVSQLGALFNQFAETNPPWFSQAGIHLKLELKMPEIVSAELPEHSSLRVDGALANRLLLTPIELPSWTNADLLTNTVVQIMVNAQGTPVSLTLLVSSGLKEADAQAMRQARAARFEPERHDTASTPVGALSGLVWGELVFKWRTLLGASAGKSQNSPH